MLPINYDHSDLVKQLCDVGRQFSRCKTVEERFLVYETYLGLVDSYFTATGKEYCNKKLYRSFVKEGENFFFEVCASNFNNFVINKDFHANLMLSCYAQLDSFFKIFVNLLIVVAWKKRSFLLLMKKLMKIVLYL